MKHLTTTALKLGLIILATAGIISACTMNCGCCGPEKAPDAEITACCTFSAHSDSLVPGLTITSENVTTTQDACNSCNCNTLPVAESNGISSGTVTLKMNQTAATVSKHVFITYYKHSVPTNIISLYTLSAASRPLRI